MDDVQAGLTSPSKAARLACLERLLSDDRYHAEVIQTLIDIENVPSNITVYRDKERYLENLLKLLRDQDVPKSEETHVIAYCHLLGSLYVNFEKFWGPTIRVIIDILNETKHQKRLLGILLLHLKDTNGFIYDETKRISYQSTEDRPDFILHRNFVFQIMGRFANFFETHSKPFMDEFFLFVHKELMTSPFIEKHGRSDLTESKSDETVQLESMELDEVQQDKPRNQTKPSKKRGSRGKKQIVPESILQKRKSRETFITVAKIISSFRNVNNIHRQSELRELVLELLCCRDSSVQKSAFNCLLIYDIEGLKPYVEKILKLLNDKKVRTELTMFSIDAEESNQVLDSHRGELIPILQRILFGRMIGHIGRKSSGRDKADNRKAFVMRFIAGCTVDEILNFFGLLFDPLSKFINVPYDQLEAEVRRDQNLKQFVPINKLKAMLVTLNAYKESVAHLREGSLPYVLKLIHIISCYVITPLEDANIINAINHKSVEALKAIRRDCLNVANEFFKSFEYYQFSQDEINFTFKYLVWPSTQGFVDKNHASITPFLKLVETFSSHQVYHKLLVKRNKPDKSDYLLRHLIDLYRDPKAVRLVTKCIASMIANLLKPDRHYIEDEEDCGKDNARKEDIEPVEDLPMFEDEDAIEPDCDINSFKINQEQDLPFGHKILLGFIPSIFERLHEVCKLFVEKQDLNNRIVPDELLILSTLSAYLRDSSQSLLATKLLLTTLEHQKNNDLILNTLRAAQSLMRQVDSYDEPSIIMNVANTLGYQRNNEQRDELCNFIDVLANIDTNLSPINQVIRLMNATCDDLVTLPDLTQWSEGFRLAFDYLDNIGEKLEKDPSLVKDSLVLLLHQVGFIINTVNKYEFSVRENCYILFEKLANGLKRAKSDEHEQFRQLIFDEILLEKFIRKGMRDTNDAIKHTFIEVLRTLAVHCHEVNRTLAEFHLFCDQNQDLDFWKNIKHIQLHNRSKALARLIANERLSEVSPKTLSCYFMPIASGFLFNKAYKTVASLSENSIKLIGIICNQINWITYESTLSYYLGLLTKANATYQKTNIKLITEIIRNFNFDLTNCEEAMQHEEENKKLEIRMKKRLGQEQEDEPIKITKRLNPSTAKMVYNAITKKIIPRLNMCFHEMTSVELQHDKNMSSYVPEKDEIKRIPMAFALVQLLSLLPGRRVLFRDHLPALFLKLASFLKSKNQDTRKAARMILIRIMTFPPVGPAYMPDLLRILKQNLDKGFHIHVLNYTIHSVLDKLSSNGLLQYGDLDTSVHELIDSCLHEIFGRVSEDKEIAQIIAKTFEAKKTKSYDTLFILAAHISSEKLSILVDAIKNHLKSSTEAKKVNKLSVCLQRVFTGLAQNEKFPLDELFTFIQSTIEESIPSLKVRQVVEGPEDKSNKTNQNGFIREDRYLIKKDKTKERIKSKINERGNLHMVVENSLRLLLLTFEKNKDVIKRKETLQRRLDGLISLLSTCLKSSSPACVMRALKCIHFITQTKSDLPSFKTKCNSIVKKIFILLSLYNGVGMVQGENYEMIGMCFKTLTLLLLRCEHVHLNDEQIYALTTYIGQDLSDTSRQSTAFNALHSLLQRKCQSSQLADLMNQVADLLVTSSDDSVRAMAIKSWQTYLLDYKHEGEALQLHLSKFLRQIDYEHIDGRKSVIRMLKVVIERFPERILRDHLELFFHLLAQRIVNEESKEVRLNVGHLIGLLIQRLPDKQGYIFNKFVLPWASGQHSGLKILGIKLISIYVEACKSMFDKNKERLSKILTIISEALETKETTPLANGKDNNGVETDHAEEDDQPTKQHVRLLSAGDRLHYHSLRLFKRLLEKELITCIESRHIDLLKKIWQNIASDKLSHWHESVVSNSCQLYLLFIRNTGLKESLKVEYPVTDNYLDWNATRIVRLLCDKFMLLLDRFDHTSKTFNYIMEGLVLLGQLVAHSHATMNFEEGYRESFEGGDIVNYLLNLNELPKDGFDHNRLPYQLAEAKKKADLMWLATKIVMQARKEAALFRMSQSYRRDFVLKWTAAVAQELGPGRIEPYVLLFIMTPVRELTDKAKNKTREPGEMPQHNLIGLSEDLLKFVKSLMGVELFNKVYSKVQLHYTRKRVERKKNEALLKVKDQARGVKRKIKQHKEKDTKRRRVKAKARKEVTGRNIRNNKRLRT